MNKLFLPGGSGRGLARGGGFVSSGIQNIRAPIVRPGSRLVTITKGTYIDLNDDVNHSADGLLGGTAYDTGILARRVVLKLDSPVSARDKFFLDMGIQAEATAELYAQENIDPGNSPSGGSEVTEVWQELKVYPITDWGGLDETTIRWANQGDLTLAAGIDPLPNKQIVYAYGEQNLNTTDVTASGGGGQMTRNGSYVASSYHGGIHGEFAVPTTVRGFIFYHILFYNNAWVNPDPVQTTFTSSLPVYFFFIPD